MTQAFIKFGSLPNKPCVGKLPLWSVIAASLFVIQSHLAFGDASIQPCDLRCECLVDPQGIDVAVPRLSWAMTAGPGARRGLRQTAFQIRVSSSADKLPGVQSELWDSGKIDSSECVNVRYAGTPLTSLRECVWQVRIWDDAGQLSGWSKPAKWSMGLLGPSDWKAQWIGIEPERMSGFDSKWIWYPEGQPQSSAPVCTRYFRKVLTLAGDRKITRAALVFTADNEASFDVNGKTVGRENNFHNAKRVDITTVLHPGSNVLAVTVRNTGDGPNPAGFVAQVEVTFDRADPVTVITDASWKASKEEAPGWTKTGFSDAEWVAAKELGQTGMAPWGQFESGERVLPARQLRKEFIADKAIRRATVCYSGLGWSELYINGSKVGNEVLSPPLSDYTKRVFYVTHDVTSLVKQGDNAIGVWLGNGRYFAPRLTVPAETQTYGLPKLMLQLHIEYVDGTTAEVMSDRSWRATSDGAVTANNEYDGEEYDARKEAGPWTSAHFEDAKWQTTDQMPAPSGQMAATMIDPTRVTGVLKPVSVKQVKTGAYVFDMGQNFAGWCQLRVAGPRGTKISLRHAERLRSDGTLYVDNLRSAKATDTYILKGGGPEVYEPRFTLHGFQYVEMAGFPGIPTLSNLEGHIVNDDLETAGAFDCSNPLLNHIYRNIVWGTRSNYRSIVTDCCQRDERQGWLGDRNEESRGESYLFRNGLLYAKWIQDMADSQRGDGIISDVCPDYWQFYTNSVTWPSSMVVIPGMLMDQYADTSVLDRSYPNMVKWMDQMAGYIKDDTLPRDSYGDWCMPPSDPHEIHSTEPGRQTSGTLIGTAYYYNCLRLMSRYAAVLKKPNDVARFDALAERLKDGMNHRFYKKDSGEYDNGTVTSSVLPLAFGMVPEYQRTLVVRHLADRIISDKNHISTGLIGCQWINTVLARNGRADLAYAMATQTTYPSLGYMVEQHATTIWELWNGNTADPAMNSGNHVMLVGDLCKFLYEDIAGIRPDPNRPGFSHVIMRPTPVGNLTAASGTHRSAYGVVSSSWTLTAGSFSWNITIPPNTTASIFVPAEKITDVSESGKPAFQAAGLTFVAVRDGRAEFTAGSGEYHFLSRLDKSFPAEGR